MPQRERLLAQGTGPFFGKNDFIFSVTPYAILGWAGKAIENLTPTKAGLVDCFLSDQVF